MSNSYNTQPILISSTFSTGWRANQTLNTNQWGIRVAKVDWTGRTASQPNSFTIQDPVSETIFLEGQSVDGANPADLQYPFDGQFPNWRDFSVPTLTSGTLLIWYRA